MGLTRKQLEPVIITLVTSITTLIVLFLILTYVDASRDIKIIVATGNISTMLYNIFKVVWPKK
jgi:hypothetical protein